MHRHFDEEGSRIIMAEDLHVKLKWGEMLGLWTFYSRLSAIDTSPRSSEASRPDASRFTGILVYVHFCILQHRPAPHSVGRHCGVFLLWHASRDACYLEKAAEPTTFCSQLGCLLVVTRNIRFQLAIALLVQRPVNFAVRFRACLSEASCHSVHSNEDGMAGHQRSLCVLCLSSWCAIHIGQAYAELRY